MGTTHKKTSSLWLEWCPSVWTRTAALGRSSWGQFQLYQSEFSREIELVWYVQIHTNAFSMGIGPHNHRGRGTPSSVSCKLEAKENRWCHSNPHPKAREPGALRSKNRRQQMSQLKQRTHSPFPCFLFYSGPPWFACSPLTLVRVIYFTSSLIWKLISSWNSLMDMSRNNNLPAIWVSLSPVRWTHKIEHHPIWEQPVLLESTLSPALQRIQQKLRGVASSLGYVATQADHKVDGFTSMRVSRFGAFETMTLDFNTQGPPLLTSRTL